jgi:hypothetical protein
VTNNAWLGHTLTVHQTALSKGKGHPITGHEGPTGGIEVQLYSFSTSALGGGAWSAPRPGRFTPGKAPVPTAQEGGWAPGPVWTCTKNLAPTGIRSPDRPARSQSLYRHELPGPDCIAVARQIHNYPLAWTQTDRISDSARCQSNSEINCLESRQNIRLGLLLDKFKKCTWL